MKLIGFEDAYTRVAVVASGEIRRHRWIRYLSPEEVLQEDDREGARLGCRDVFSLGACLWEWLSGRPPFPVERARRARDFDALQSILRDTPPPLDTLRSTLPGSLSAIVTRALARDPADRFGSVEAMGAALRDALDCDPALARHALAAWAAGSTPARAARGLSTCWR